MNYTKLSILLLRVSAVVMIADSVPGVAMMAFAFFDASQMDGVRIPNYLYSHALTPIAGIVLYFYSIPLAKRIAGFLDIRNNET